MCVPAGDSLDSDLGPVRLALGHGPADGAHQRQSIHFGRQKASDMTVHYGRRARAVA